MLFIATDAEERVSIWEEKQSCTQQTAQMKSIVDDILVWRIDCLLANYDDKKGRPKFEIYVCFEQQNATSKAEQQSVLVVRREHLLHSRHYSSRSNVSARKVITLEKENITLNEKIIKGH